MSDRSVTERLTEEIRAIAWAGGADAPAAIEKVLEEELSRFPKTGKLQMLREVASQFAPSKAGESAIAGLQSIDSNRVASLFLGREIVRSGLSQEEMSERLVKSLNTIFDTLNQIIATIHSTLLGQKGDEDTIRQIIGSEIKGETGDRSLQGYLEQIQQAFLIAHKAFSMAAGKTVAQILSELDPEKIAGSAEGRRKFGPLRKAEFFEAYQDKYRLCKSSFESGRITEEFLREFEKTCERLFKK